VTPRIRAAASAGPKYVDQVLRLSAYRAAHPHVHIRAGAGYWQAVIPEERGEAIITRYELDDLLDRLDTVGEV
jgi:hypothetical protein